MHHGAVLPYQPASRGAPVARFVDALLCWACRTGASALCLRWGVRQGAISARVDGAGRALATGSAAQLHAIARALAECVQEPPAHGPVAALLERYAIELRHGPSSPSGGSLRLAIRALGAQPLALEQLGLETEEHAVLERVAAQPQGLVLVAGPAQSGRTASLYAMLDRIDAVARCVHTIESPPHAERALWSQWTPGAGPVDAQWRTALGQVLDFDPGVLLFDVRAARPPIRRLLGAVEAGWSVLVPVTLERATHVFAHYRARGVAPEDLARGLSLVVAQRLVRALCHACAQPDDSPEVRNVMARAANSWLLGETLRTRCARSGGCAHCGGTGYRGRALLCEALEIGAGVRAMAGEGLAGQDMELSAIGEGRSLWDHGLRLLARGSVSLQSLRGALREPV